MKKILFTATLRSHIAQFHQPYMKFFKDAGWEVHIATRDNTDLKKISLDHYDVFHPIEYERSPWKLKNCRAFFQMRRLLKKEHYDIIHCHTPMAAAITRIVTRPYRSNGTIVIYTAHGFHFFYGAPKKNWQLYFPVEKRLSRDTDCLITINKEDYHAAINHDFKANSLEQVNGVGVDLKAFIPQNPLRKLSLREQYDYDPDQFILLCAGNLSYRKHQDLIIKAVSMIHKEIPNLKVIIAGTGESENQYRDMIRRYHLEHIFQLIGYVRDIPNYMALSDAVVSASRQEGLPINIIEAMATGLPIIATDCRGNNDLIENRINGLLVDIEDAIVMSQAILELYQKPSLREIFGQANLKKVKQYGLDSVLEEMKTIYRRYM